ncbi:MAG: hypothetical protein K2X81_04140 [Candidatus Obscuribacterales bacterium]|nr:hypothetical protein [Candidatus Obscuribacterales bacterium]
MNPQGPMSQGKIKITSADWLAPNWVFGLHIAGGMELTKIESINPQQRAQTIIQAIERIRTQANCSAIFMTKEDCAIVSEYFPESFKRED